MGIEDQLVTLGSAQLSRIKNEALPLLHVGFVRITNRVDQRTLLDRDSVTVSRDRHDRDQREADPAPSAKPIRRTSSSACIRGVAHKPVRARSNHRLIGPRLHITGEIFPERAPAVASQQAAKKRHQHSSYEQRYLPVLWKGPGFHERERVRECHRCRRSTHYHLHGAAVFRVRVLRAFTTALNNLPLGEECPEVDCPKTSAYGQTNGSGFTQVASRLYARACSISE